MRRSILLFGSLFLVLVAFQTIADQSTGEVPAEPPEALLVEPAETEDTPAPEMELEADGTRTELFPEPLLFAEPQPASSCNPPCSQQCNQSCGAGCFCIGSCHGFRCYCSEICP